MFRILHTHFTQSHLKIFKDFLHYNAWIIKSIGLIFTTNDWADHLPWVMLGIRASLKEESGTSAEKWHLGTCWWFPVFSPGRLLTWPSSVSDSARYSAVQDSAGLTQHISGQRWVSFRAIQDSAQRDLVQSRTVISLTSRSCRQRWIWSSRQHSVSDPVLYWIRYKWLSKSDWEQGWALRSFPFKTFRSFPF